MIQEDSVKVKMYPFPCCGYKTLDEEPPGTYDICHICFWEDDPAQFDHPAFGGGANGVSLIEAQKNFEEFGACEKRFIDNVRKPAADDERDPDWRLIFKKNYKCYKEKNK